MAQQPNPHNAQLANLEPGEAATTAVTILAKATINTARAHPKITGSWMLGLALVVFATGFRVSDAVASQYEQDVQAADLSEPISRAAARVRREGVCSEAPRAGSPATTGASTINQRRRPRPGNWPTYELGKMLDYQTPKKE